MAELRPTTDGLVTIRPPVAGDAQRLILGRDVEFQRWLGPGSESPDPLGCIEVDDEVVGWIDYDVDRSWLEPGEVNVGYNVFAPHRGHGYATRAVQLLMHHLAVDGTHRTATLLIHPENHRSLSLATRARFGAHGDLDGNPYFKRSVPPLDYTDGTVTIRCQRVDDVEAEMAGKDESQITWLWLPGQREAWSAMTPEQQRAHTVNGLCANIDAFEVGPKWAFSVDVDDASCIAYVDCNLANERVPRGEANIAYAAHPAHRGRGHITRAVRLVIEFLTDHTAASEAHIIVDEDNAASLRVVEAVGAIETSRMDDDNGRSLIRHVLAI